MNEEEKKNAPNNNIILKVGGVNEWQKSASSSNIILKGDGFYISFNPTPVKIQHQETALIDTRIRTNRPIYVLQGDHRAAYEELIEKGFEDCYNYYLSQQSQ